MKHEQLSAKDPSQCLLRQIWYCYFRDFVKRNKASYSLDPSQLYREHVQRMTFPMYVRVIGPWSLIVSTLFEALSITEMIYWVWQIFFEGYFHSKNCNNSYFWQLTIRIIQYFPKDLKGLHDILESFVLFLGGGGRVCTAPCKQYSVSFKPANNLRTIRAKQGSHFHSLG